MKAQPVCMGLVALFFLAACVGPRLAPHKASGIKTVAKVPSLKPHATPTPAPVYPQSRPLDQARPVKVRSRRLRYDQKTQETVFYGGVTVTQDTTMLKSRELRTQTKGQSARASGGVLMTDLVRHFWVLSGQADYADSLREASLSQGVHFVTVDPYGSAITVTGQSGSYWGLSRGAEVGGGVKVLRGPMQATALSATVSDGGISLLLESDVHAAMGFNRLQSDRALFNQKDHSVDLEGDVRVRLIPSEVRNAAAAPWSISPSAVEGP